jgi:hypothetical protein
MQESDKAFFIDSGDTFLIRHRESFHIRPKPDYFFVDSILGRRFFYANPFWHNAFVLMCSTIKIEYYFVYVEQRAFTFSVFRADGKLFRLDFLG